MHGSFLIGFILPKKKEEEQMKDIEMTEEVEEKDEFSVWFIWKLFYKIVLNFIGKRYYCHNDCFMNGSLNRKCNEIAWDLLVPNKKNRTKWILLFDFKPKTHFPSSVLASLFYLFVSLYLCFLFLSFIQMMLAHRILFIVRFNERETLALL